MRTRTKIILLALSVLIFFTSTQIYAAQQANDYRAYVQSNFIDKDQTYEGNNVTYVANIAYVPVYGSATYTLTIQPLSTKIDLSKPTTINDQIAAAVKNQGNSLGYNVIRVFVPSYEMKVV